METVIDIRLALENLGTGWQFGGSVTAGTQDAWDAVVWEDERDKPTWDELLEAHILYEVEAAFASLRKERDTRINSILWMRERHSDELELGPETSLTPEQYTALLTYIQALRDLPAQPGAPWPAGDIPWPVLPVEL